MTDRHRPEFPEHITVTVLGLGLMGRALAGAFLRAGHPTTVWNRTAAKADDLVARGARLAGSASAAVAAGDLVVVCVSDHDAVRAVLDPLAGGLGGRVLVNLTSGTSRAAREIAAWAARQGADYLDGAIMAVPGAIGTPGALVLYSGPRPAFERYEPVLRRLGGARYLGGDQGLSALHDVAVLSLMWNILNGFLQGAALLGAAGVDATTFAPLARTAIETVTGWLPDYARQVDDGAYPALDSTLDTHVAAMAHLIGESESLGVDPALPRFVKALADRAVAEGHGGAGYAALAELFRTPAGERP
ncbi:3-hydroxyisobutyrate dehydrogenase-like beta-hydroxyacid dehydrogenase [Prauserella shujinwangii]|uniref:3-hydroxyisobutyrate dehydrogenase-like beta-hydroxyacid dehydrogenase n=1 Tax=Prauserella shujinwangii TaxID=1453103 RepID=A0A2T0M407_9PSEU|nr:NAD(P)-binding domain-containing protein [Prauserella shujinwangii]PRX51488.1 3-hydroxyisobutyrate dehydrogenase-like beta-hydroxyacid dehydrogenase [Prauserella shujinwangii]